MSEPAAAAIALTGSDQQVYTGTGVYRGFAMRENSGGAGAAASADIYDGTSTAGVLIDTVALAALASKSEWYGTGGIRVATGIYVDIVAGTIKGSVRIG